LHPHIIELRLEGAPLGMKKIGEATIPILRDPYLLYDNGILRYHRTGYELARQ